MSTPKRSATSMPSVPSEPWTVLRLLDWTKDYFAGAELESPRLAAEILLAHVLRCKRIDLYARYEYRPSKKELEEYRKLVRRAADHEPIAYLVGRKEFYSLAFKMTEGVLIPRPETEILVDQAVAYFKGLGRGGLLWDVCTGCGCVAVAVAANVEGSRVLATDISRDAVLLAGENAAAHGVAERVTCRQCDLLSLPDDWEHGREFDAITANPPYVPDREELSATVQHEPALALRGGADGLDLIRRIIADAPDVLRPGGRLILEFGHDQRDAVVDLIAAAGAFGDPQIILDHQSIARVAVAERK